jgi:hypothetical protein
VNAIIDAGWHPDDITAQTIDRDFQRSRRIHQCWVITGNC